MMERPFANLSIRSGFVASSKATWSHCLLWCCLVAALPLGNDCFAQSDTLEQAISEYTAAMDTKPRNERLARFSRAEQLFRQAVDSLASNGQSCTADLWANYANAALQAEHVGIAIAAYRRALSLSPDHSQATQNLRYARSTLPEWAQRTAGNELVDTLFFWNRLYSAKQVAIASGVCFLIAALLIAAGIFVGSGVLRNIALGPLLVWLLLLVSLLVRGDAAENESVVAGKEAILYSADSENAPPRMNDPLPDGAEVTVLQTRDRWTEIQLAGRSGWVRSSALEPVLAPQN